ncbi:hypothetical protein YPPY60_1959, partial [Yersinia pestis PY-60]
MPTTLHDI